MSDGKSRLVRDCHYDKKFQLPINASRQSVRLTSKRTRTALKYSDEFVKRRQTSDALNFALNSHRKQISAFHKRGAEHKPARITWTTGDIQGLR